ncbi:Thiosulfate sulfurtransferase 18 [Hibiscus syriacus]|uniref:Thiosulfate sulfurtransferase 18 n=1 Tax=Hibiscus syriacus TaxID=106335 RepID=A0A6A3ANY2_HIBSY|nr:Thiosulfate sulfurtransferase 18 [Hibiscus syriacus]
MFTTMSGQWKSSRRDTWKQRRSLIPHYMFNTPEGIVKNPEFLKDVSSAFKEEDRLVVGCKSGVRSLSAAADLLKIGFKDVRNLGGGYLAWVDNGFGTKMEETAMVDQEKLKGEL